MKHLKLFLTTIVLSILVFSCESDDVDSGTNDNFASGSQSNSSNMAGSFKGIMNASSARINPLTLNGLPVNTREEIEVEVIIREIVISDDFNDVDIKIKGINNNFELQFNGFVAGFESILFWDCVKCLDNSDNEVTGIINKLREKRKVGVLIPFIESGGTANDTIIIEIIEN